jgi:hypothetical protein
MKNVTITLTEEVARWVRIKAAENNTSVSRLVGDMLQVKMQVEESYGQPWSSIWPPAPES